MQEANEDHYKLRSETENLKITKAWRGTRRKVELLFLAVGYNTQLRSAKASQTRRRACEEIILTKEKQIATQECVKHDHKNGFAKREGAN